MRLKVLACVALVGLAAPATAATYANARFGYAVSYPETLLEPRPEAANGDGREFRSRSDRARFSVFASADLEATPAGIEQAAEEVCQGTRPALRVVKRRLVAMSCIHDGLIYYTKVLLGSGAQVKLIAAYPAAERNVWDRVIVRMASSLTPASR